MSGPLTQLSALGLQDAYLQIDSEVTFFKQMYKRHTNFAIDSLYNQFTQTPKLGYATQCTVQRTADLLNKMWLHVTLPALNTGNKWPKARYCDEVGFALINEVSVEIGSMLIDKHYGHYLQAWNQLTCSEEKRFLDHLVGKTGGDVAQLEENAKRPQELWIPLQFWFNRHLGYSLPLVALQYHEVKINVNFASLSSIVSDPGNGRSLSALSLENQDGFSAELLCNYVYLDDAERHWFAGNAHEYLVETLQYSETTMTDTQTTFNATFNHPCTELIWVLISQAAVAANEPFCYGALDKSYNLAGDPLIKAKLVLNGHERVAAQGPEYFREIVPSLYHTAIPRKNIYVYSFSLEPEDWRPAGSINFSRIDSVRLVVEHIEFKNMWHPNLRYKSDGSKNTVDGGKLRVYCRSRNILRISSGLAGVVFAN